MADPKGFLTTGREVAETRPAEERVKDWNEVYVPGSLLDHQQAGQAAAWTAASRSATTAVRSET